jgi:hypothetical protein
MGPGRGDIDQMRGREKELTQQRSAKSSSHSGGLVEIGQRRISSACLSLVFLVACSVLSVGAEQIFAPEYLWRSGLAEKTDPLEIANTFLGIPYRDDGTLDSSGYFTTFAHSDRTLESPGLNCSGLVVSVCRFLFNRNWTLEQVSRDRQGSSGPGSALGEDWDFGWNLILNITDDARRRIIMPDGSSPAVDGADGTTLRGFNLHDVEAWGRVLDQMEPGRVYLGSISKSVHDRVYELKHYHVVLMLPDAKGGVWLYHATRRSNVHCMNINTPQGMSRFMSEFKARGDSKKILVVEALLPNVRVGPEPTERKQGPVPHTPGSPARAPSTLW